ncbi:unnamed protein product, partial [Mesorhabditis belari]|uniref:G-protein coupled receptors family 1 profile domain-containing protein n=1 Tax=Mesorhabditis belari TaxID=2138241 RepID=A0AAF3EHD7_9BILA
MYPHWVLLLLFCLLIVIALFGNLLVCAAIFWDRHLRRQPENLFLVSLAISDLLVSILVMIFAAASDLLGQWPFGNAYCQFWVAFDITTCTASILNLAAICLDRYCHISRPMVYVRYCNRRRISYGIILVWVLSALIGAAPLGFGFGSHVTWDLHNKTACEMRLPLAYAVCSSMLSFFVPAAVMVFLYTKLYLYAQRHVRSIQTQLKQATSFLIMQLASEKIREDEEADSYEDEATAATLRNGTAAPTPPSPKELLEDVPRGSSFWDKFTRVLHVRRNPVSEEAQQQQRNTVSDQKARLTLGVIMGTFLFCWTPFFLVNIWRSWSPHDINKEAVQAVTWLGYANSTVNPIIYSIFNRDFRRAFKKIIVKLFSCFDRGKHDYGCVRNGVTDGGLADRKRSYTRSSETPENNNQNRTDAVATRLVLLNNNESSVIVEE